ncbi:Protein ltv1 [Coemansia sp. RSA 2167]|nr:Protein ltv1 [Coemansia sp. RSA 1824]KAJ1787910.1 Protein ltv1 [Coemansia sp. RSA 2167]KAJ2408561.1 Protein ltv1 [Coemansia sp. RSA 2526]KAJ2649324.1 Protein ltv1 [Coemansia sp. RSA 1287]
MGKQFISKKSGKTYNLVFRSQEDPLAFEEGSTDRVFVERGKQRRAARGNDVADDFAALGLNTNDAAGQAALYGIFLDDRKYDYTQHLRKVGSGGGIMLEAPAKKDKRSEIAMRSDLPAEALPSTHRMDIRSAPFPTGPQPYMDADVRDALEALSGDDADDLDDDLMAKLNADELSSNEAEFDDDDDFDPEDVFAHVQRMKQHRVMSDDEWSQSDRAPSTSQSMTSSTMHRNDKLTLLDEQFDRIEAMYEDSDSEAERYDSDGHYIPEYDAMGNAKPLSTRADFESVLNEFLNDYELTGKKMQAVVEGGTGAGKLGTYRDGLAGGEESRKAVVRAAERILDEAAAKTDEQDAAEVAAMFQPKERTAWDCQSILSTYSTLDNHPATIHEARAPRIRVSRKSGFPVVDAIDENSDEGGDEEPREDKGVARNKTESAEEKRARKRQVQEERRQRREEKRETRGVFAEKRDRREQSKNDRRQYVVHL